MITSCSDQTTTGLRGPQGEKGETGAQGLPGEKGDTGETGAQGPQGNPGEDGADGKSAYELAVENGYTGTVEEWLASLAGENGDIGAQGIQGEKGETGAQGIQGEKGETGAQGEKGEAGRGVKDIWLDDDLHLWVEYDDGSEPIDLGYVGVSTPAPTPDPEFTEPTIVVSNVTASAGDTNAEVTIALKNNPGVALIDFKVEFDTAILTLAFWY